MRDTDDIGGSFFSIRDVYYRNDKPHSYGANPQYPIGESKEELHEDLSAMMEAFQKPILQYNKETSKYEEV